MTLLETIKQKNGITFRKLHRNTAYGQASNFHKLSAEIKLLAESGLIYIRRNSLAGDQLFLMADFTCEKCAQSTPAVTQHPDSLDHCMRCHGIVINMRQNADKNKMMLAWQSKPIAKYHSNEVRGGYCP